jgi:hypothetical protein
MSFGVSVGKLAVAKSSSFMERKCYEDLADYYGLKGRRKYVAEREWWNAPLVPRHP